MMFHYTRLRPWSVVLLLSVIYLGVIFTANDADPEVFVTPGECFSRCAGADGTACAPDTEGYDGLSVGQDAAIPWAFVAINLVALVSGTALFETLLVQAGASRWYALSYGLFAGVFMAVRLSTNEALAYGLVIAAMLFAVRERVVWAAVMLALAGVTKETTGVFAVGYLLYLALHRRWWDSLRAAVVAGGPFVIWQIILLEWLGTPGGVWKIATEGSVLAFLVLGVLLVIPAAVMPSLWGLWRSVRDLRRGERDLAVCLLLANAAIMPFVPFSTYREFLGLLRFMPGLVIAVVWYAARHRQRRALVYSTLWIVLIAFVVAG